MNNFLKNLLIFLLPVILLGSSMEILLRRIPNDYAYKASYLNENSEKIEVLFLGSSHAYRDINPVYMHANSFNAGYVSQSLYFDYEIFKQHLGHWDHLEYIVIPISYFSLFMQLDSTPEAWRVKNYEIYYGMTTSGSLSDYFELFSNKADTNLERIRLYYWLGQSNTSSSKLGWGAFPPGSKPGLLESGKTAAERHKQIVEDGEANLKVNMDILNAFIAYANAKGIKLIFYTPPAYHSYVENLNKEKLDQSIAILTQLDKEYEHVIYINYLNDPSFTETDFFNADHLDVSGAEKLTKKIDALITIH